MPFTSLQLDAFQFWNISDEYFRLLTALSWRTLIMYTLYTYYLKFTLNWHFRFLRNLNLSFYLKLLNVVKYSSIMKIFINQTLISRIFYLLKVNRCIYLQLELRNATGGKIYISRMTKSLSHLYTGLTSGLNFFLLKLKTYRTSPLPPPPSIPLTSEDNRREYYVGMTKWKFVERLKGHCTVVSNIILCKTSKTIYNTFKISSQWL